MKIFIFGIVLQILSRASATLKVFLKRLLRTGEVFTDCKEDRGAIGKGGLSDS